MNSESGSFIDQEVKATAILRRLRISVWLLAAGAGFVQAWANRLYIEPDGVNYFDVADAYLRRDWANALNAYWSPLYSWLLALIQLIFHPSAYWEAASLHLLNLVLLLFALAAFEFFFRRLLKLLNGLGPQEDESKRLPEWTWWALAYAAFLIGTLRLTDLHNDNPDLAVMAVVFLAAGMLADLGSERLGVLHYFLLGLLLGLGYLAKGVMLPLSLLYVVVATFAPGSTAKPLRALAVLGGFLVVSTPFATALSHAKGRVTFGETGKVAYINAVSGANNVKPAHSPVLLYDNPPVNLYVTPYTATYQFWYDSSYWFEGVKPRFVLSSQLRVIGSSVSAYFRIISTEKQWICGWLALLLLAGDWRGTLQRFFRLWFVWVPSVAALGLYALVLIEPRYVGASLTLLCVVLFAALPWPRMQAGAAVRVAVVLAVSLTSCIIIVKDAAANLGLSLRHQEHIQWQVAQELKRMGLAPGDRVAFLGHTTVAYYWARLGGLRVVSDIPLESVQTYWLAPPRVREEISDRLRAQGIKALVTAGPPLIPANWQSIGNTGHYVEFLDTGHVTAAAASH